MSLKSWIQLAWPTLKEHKLMSDQSNCNGITFKTFHYFTASVYVAILLFALNCSSFKKYALLLCISNNLCVSDPLSEELWLLWINENIYSVTKKKNKHKNMNNRYLFTKRSSEYYLFFIFTKKYAMEEQN